METDYYSCGFCGCVIDVLVLKRINDKKSNEEHDKEDYNSSYIYRDYYDFIKFRCPACKLLNQR